MFDLTDFQTDVLDASRERPVLVDFWAPWCGPCRILSPVLEDLAARHGDRWRLVKINSDEHPDLSMQYGVRGIPNVKLFVDGEVVDEFTGAMPAHAVEQWLDQALPTETSKRLAVARTALEAGRTDEARPLLETVLRDEPDHDEARLLLAQAVVFDDPARAEALVREATPSTPAQVQTAEAVQTLTRLGTLAADASTLPDSPAREPYLAAARALHTGDYDTALTNLIQVLQRDRYYDDDGARKAGIALFTLLGPQHPATRKHRRLFDMYLY